MSNTLLDANQLLANSLNTLISEFRLRRDYSCYSLSNRPTPKNISEAGKMRLKNLITEDEFNYYMKKF